MAISRFQMNRQLRAYGGIMGQDGRRNYGIGSFFQEKIMDPIKKVVKSPVGAGAAALALNQFGVPFTKGMGVEGGRIGQGSISRGLSSILKGIGIGGGGRSEEVMNTGQAPKTTIEKISDFVTKPRFPNPNQKNTGPQSIGDRLLSGIFGAPGLAVASGLVAGALTKDKEDPIYTGQDVGLNLQDIAKLANLSDPKTASAIGLRFSPDVESRKFTPAEMAETYAANAPQDFTEKREQAQDGGIMGDQKDFEEFLQDMKDRDMGAMQDQILKDFQKYMERKKMIEQLPEAKDGGIMKMADGGMMDMGGMEMDLRGGGFVPMGRAEKADDVPARLSKNEFVFTADAVRAAGGGNVDKGADKMYATMKKLEDRVA